MVPTDPRLQTPKALDHCFPTRTPTRFVRVAVVGCLDSPRACLRLRNYVCTQALTCSLSASRCPLYGQSEQGGKRSVTGADISVSQGPWPGVEPQSSKAAYESVCGSVSGNGSDLEQKIRMCDFSWTMVQNFAIHAAAAQGNPIFFSCTRVCVCQCVCV